MHPTTSTTRTCRGEEKERKSRRRRKGEERQGKERRGEEKGGEERGKYKKRHLDKHKHGGSLCVRACLCVCPIKVCVSVCAS